MNINYYIDALKNYANFNGRATRSQYWYFVLINFLISLVLSFVLPKSISAYISGIYTLAVFIPGISVAARRLHDINKSGWMLLVSLIPFIGWIWIIILLATETYPKDNKFGPAPKKSL